MVTVSWGKRVIVSCVLLVGLMLSTTVAWAAFQTDSASYSDTTYYNQLPYAINWTDVYTPYGYTCGSSDACLYSITGQNQGGCVQNTSTYPFNQAVAGRVQYYWSGGSQGPIYSAYGGSTICQSTSSAWGGADTATSPNVVYWKVDPAGTDYNSVFSQWTSTQTFPGYFSRTRYIYWN